jgi:hypothetical protein
MGQIFIDVTIKRKITDFLDAFRAILGSNGKYYYLMVSAEVATL